MIISESTKPLRLALLNLTDAIRTMAGNFRAEVGFKSRPGSPAALEMKESKRPKSLETSISAALTLIGIAEQHLDLFSKTTSLISLTSARNALEPSAIATWLMDPDIDGHERVGRLFAYRFSGQFEMRKFYRSAGAQAKAMETDEAIQEILIEAKTLGYHPLKTGGKNSRIDALHTRDLNGATRLIGTVLGDDAEEVYRLLSAVAHGHMWAVHALSYEIHAELNLAEQIDNPRAISLTGCVASESYAKAVWNYATYMGWDTDLLAKELEVVAHQFVGFDRFWN